MRLKANILAVASSATLRQIAEDLELSISDRRRRQTLIDSIASTRRCHPGDILGYLSEPEIKQVCEAVGIDSSGRKNTLIARLLEAAVLTREPIARARRLVDSWPEHSIIRQREPQ
jgi:hypothetical protein